MARCRRCGIEIEAAADLEPDFCEACLEDFPDENEEDGDEADGVARADDYGLPSLDWMTDEPT
jgi:hypothetical protein